MTNAIADAVHPSRLRSYRLACANQLGVPEAEVSESLVTSMYVWQVSLSAAWFETLAYTEAILRNAIDAALRRWNLAGGGTEDWLANPLPPLKGLITRMCKETVDRATRASRARDGNHPRAGQAVTLDDRVSQLTLGHLAFLFPRQPPTQRTTRASGYNARENLWLHALRTAFPLSTRNNPLQSLRRPGSCSGACCPD